MNARQAWNLATYEGVGMRIQQIVAMLAFSTLPCIGCDEGPRLGTAGESCRSRNDCGRDLACVRNTCVPGGLGLSATGRECYRVECTESADCCADFVPDANCAV